MSALVYENSEIVMKVAVGGTDAEHLGTAVRTIGRYARFGHRGVTDRFFDQITAALVEDGQWSDDTHHRTRSEFRLVGDAEDLAALSDHARPYL